MICLRTNQLNCRGCRLAGGRNRVRLKSDFLNRFNAIWVVQSSLKKYSATPHPKLNLHQIRNFRNLLDSQLESEILTLLSHPSEGRLENVTDAGWDAVDADGA
jgi:hypothetical protein